ncbi:hypothetical protein Sango_1238800 [Sesamum angolense]|uniref:Reverse transcriptase RNase H-like domain-containing protein n=1 Tax=Sesamum angolense TaxID=2727404 RepID=A0AAE1WR12_9LAMI|nr:hypothetical protein Sango_1238800 [Sesamum angolense]
MAKECYATILKRSRERLGGSAPIDKGKMRIYDSEHESADKGLPFFKVLRGAAKFEWINSGQEAFDVLKSSVLVRQEGKEHHVVYYVSKVLQGVEIRYSQIEKLALSLVVAVRKLKHYFQSHQMIVLTNHPLKQVLSNPELSGKMVKWAMELCEFDIESHPRSTIKASVLAKSSLNRHTIRHASPRLLGDFMLMDHLQQQEVGTE